MKFSTSFALASLAALSNAAAVEQVRPRLDVHLEKASDTSVKVSVTNNGNSDLKLLNQGTILDKGHTEKMHMFSGPSKLPFHGIRKHVSTSKNLDNILTPLKKGQTINRVVNTAELHDLSEGGEFTAHSVGTIPYAHAHGHKIKGVADYNSNKLSMNIDGKVAAAVPRAYSHIRKRATEESDCSGSQGEAVTNALNSCTSLAARAANTARTDASLVNEYFHSTDNSTRSIVSARLDAVSKQCASSTSGVVQFHCQTDVANDCSDNIVAYTLPPENVVVACPIFYTLPATAEEAELHNESQDTTVIHEFTHADGVYSPGTQDNAYGYEASTALSQQQAIMNADSYALFSNSVADGGS